MAVPVDIARDEWRPKPPKYGYTPVRHTHVEWHHSVYPRTMEVVSQAQAIQRLHQVNKGWNDVFYNLGISGDGTVIELRGEGHRSQGTALTVCLFGNYDVEPVPVAVQRRMAEILLHYPHGETYHRERAAGTKYASACPGQYAIDLIESGALHRLGKPLPPPEKPVNEPTTIDKMGGGVLVQASLDEAGKGWLAVPVPFDRFAGVVEHGPFPPVDGYKWGQTSHLRFRAQPRGALTVIVVEGGKRNERVAFHVRER